MQARVVGSTCQVPGLDVFLHTRAQTGLFLGAQARSRYGYAVFEAVLVDFLDQKLCILNAGLHADGGLDFLPDFRGRLRRGCI